MCSAYGLLHLSQHWLRHDGACPCREHHWFLPTLMVCAVLLEHRSLQMCWLPDLAAYSPQASLERVGLDASAAIARARARSASRVGRKRDRSVAGVADMDVDATAAADGSQAPPAKKRIHSSKARCAEF